MCAGGDSKIDLLAREALLLLSSSVERFMGWQPTENGGTLGTAGSEGGVILRDEEHDLGARITLERHCSIAPFAVTCGIYGWFFHTRFASTETEAEYSAMSSGLEGSSI